MPFFNSLNLMFCGFVVLLFLSFSSPVLAEKQNTPDNPTEFDYYLDSFSKSKRLLLELYSDNPNTFYCGCQFDQAKNIDASQCGYHFRKSNKRGQRLEWEHVVPAHRFGSARQCWQEPASFSQCVKKNGKTVSRRKCCRTVDPDFKEMEADMMNLVPAVGELNADRSNFSFDMIEGEDRQYGQCDFEIDRKRKTVEPKQAIQGDIARIYYYFQNKYGMVLTETEARNFQQWNEIDPIDEWEVEKLNRIKQMLVVAGKKRNSKPKFAGID